MKSDERRNLIIKILEDSKISISANFLAKNLMLLDK